MAKSSWAHRTRDLIFRLADRLVALVSRRTSGPGLLVILPHALGDLLLFTPAFEHLRASFPDPITLVCGEGSRVYAATYLQPDRLLVVDRVRMRRDLLFRIRTLLAVSQSSVRIALQPGRNREHLIEDALVRASRANVRVGCAGSLALISDRERQRGDPWYTRLLPEPTGVVHETDHYADFVAATTGTARYRRLPLLARPPRYSGVPPSRYIVVAFQSSATLKTWPVEQFVKTARVLAAQTESGLVMVGHATPSKYENDGSIVDLCGETDLGQLIAVLAHADLVLCNESAPSILAASLGVPVVVVAGGGLPGRYWPYSAESLPTPPARVAILDPPMACFGCGWRCRYTVSAGKAAPCVANISPERVMEAALSLLKN